VERSVLQYRFPYRFPIRIDLHFAYVDELIATKGTCYLYIGDEDFFMNPGHSFEVVNRLDAYRGILTYTVQARIETMRSARGIPLLERKGGYADF